MRIHSPLMTNAQATGSFSGSFTGTFDGDIQADSVAYANVSGKPTLLSSSIQVNYNDVSNLTTLLQLGSTSTTALAGNTTTISNSQASAITTNSSKVGITTSQASAITTNSNKVGYTDTLVKTKLDSEGVISGSVQIDIHNTTGYEANENIDHSDITIGSGLGLSGGGTIDTNRSISLNTSSTHFTDGVKSKLDSDNVLSGSVTDIKSFLAITSADISDVAAFSQSGTYSGLRAQGTTKGDVGLGNVTNESKATMFADASLTGNATAETQADNDNSTKIATTAYVQREVSDLLGGAPAAFDTLLEISASIANGDSDVVSLTTVVGGKLQKDQNLSDLTNASTARTNLGVDAAGTDNSTDVTLANTNYLSLTGQEITGGTVPLASGGTGATSAGAARTALGVDAAGTVNYSLPTATSSTKGGITTGYTTNGKNYQVQSSGTDIYVNVPWTDSQNAKSDLGLDTGDDVTFGTVRVDDATASTSKTTGALIVDGGVGIGGDLNAGGDVVAYASSDERLKDNIQLLPDALGKVEALRGVEFDWNDKQNLHSGHDVGVIAQDIEAVLPELVETRDNGFKAVKYEKLTAVLIEAVKELSARVKELENK